MLDPFDADDEDSVYPLLIGDTNHNKLPEYLSNIHTYKFSEGDGKDNVIKLIEDMMFWRDEKT